MDSNKLQYNPNIWLNMNFNKLKLNQSKLKNFNSIISIKKKYK